jgi:hypothetical protein
LPEAVVKDIISIMGHDRTDPILLMAVCTFGLDLFDCEEIKTDQEAMEPFYRGIKDMKYLIPYLGFEAFPWLQAASSRYHSASRPAQKIE